MRLPGMAALHPQRSLHQVVEHLVLGPPHERGQVEMHDECVRLAGRVNSIEDLLGHAPVLLPQRAHRRIHRVGNAGAGRELQLRKRVHGRAGESLDVETDARQLVGREHAGAAAVAEQHDAARGVPRLRRERLEREQRVDEPIERIRHHAAGLLRERVPRPVVSRERAGVRDRRRPALPRAAALQDHDRGLIVGQTSFGKGLVQSVYPLSKNAGLALTTQKWYTPSGRLIQRDYSHISQFDYYNHRDSATPPKKEDIKRSDIGRVVYGGGGITPDYVVEEPKVNEFQTTLAAKYAVYTFVRDFLAKNPSLDTSFQVSDALIDQFHQHITKRGVEFTEKDFQDNKDYIKRSIKYEVFYNRLGVAEAGRVVLEGDPQVIKALELIPEARDLASKARRQMADRR